MSQQTPISGYPSFRTTPSPKPAEISSMPNTPLQQSDLDAVSIKRTKDKNTVSPGSASPPRESELCGSLNHRIYGPREPRARTSLMNRFEPTSKEFLDSVHADHRKESPDPDENEKLIKPYIMTATQSLKAKIPELTHDPDHVEDDATDQLWRIKINKKLNKATRDNEKRPWAQLCIYRIPPQLLDADEKDTYLPQAVTLGPYNHHITKRVKNMKSHKWRALQCTLKRTDRPIDYYLKGVKDLEQKARACYQGKLHLSSNGFVEMMVLDSCFILDIFRGFASENGFTELGYLEDDPVFAMRATMHLIQGDMIMLENQIPLFVLDRVLGLQNGDPDQKGIVARLAIKFFDPLTPTDVPSTLRNEMVYKSFADGLHCLDVFRRYLLEFDIPTQSKHAAPRVATQSKGSNLHLHLHYLVPALPTTFNHFQGNHAAPRVEKSPVDKRQQLMVHCAIELKEAGIKFQRIKTDRFWNIQYEKGVLKIPRLLIHDGTKSLLLNLIAYERCHVGCTNEVTEYVIFMDNLVGTAADVSFLHRRGIIEHWLGNDEDVADLFSQLNRTCQEVVFGRNGNYLSTVSADVDKYYNGKWNNLVANLRHTYFTNPWTTISLLAAATLLLLTLVQTFYTVYGYYRPT